MAHEDERSEDWFSAPGNSIRIRMHRLGVTADELAKHLQDGIGEVRELLSGKRSVDHRSASALCVVLGGTQDFWIRRQENYEKAFTNALQAALDSEDDWVGNIPMLPKPNIGSISKGKMREEIRRRMLYYNIPTLASWEKKYGNICRDTHFRRSNSFVPLNSAVLLWLRRGEIEADLVHTQSWSPKKLKDQLHDIRKLTKISNPNRFLPILRSLCAEAGVAVVIGETPRGCYASGAVRLISTDKAMMLLSFRHLRDDQFWFTVFHEIGHLVLHQNETFVDGDDCAQDSKFEKEANDFARDQMVPTKRQHELQNLRINKKTITRFSVQCGIAPGLVVGQLQHYEIIDHGKMNSLKRHWKRKDIEHNFRWKFSH